MINSFKSVAKFILAVLLTSCLLISITTNFPQRLYTIINGRIMIRNKVWPYAEVIAIRKRLEEKNKPRIVMFGDSLTEWGPWKNDSFDYKFVNLGVGGNTTANLLNRIHQVKAVSPSAVYIMAGVNDIFTEIPQEQTIKNYADILDSLKSNEFKVIVTSTLPLSSLNSKYVETNSKIQALNSRLRKLAVDRGVEYYDLAKELVLTDVFVLPNNLTVDSVHLSTLAYSKWVLSLTEKLRGSRH